jgi:hypothetical protein
MVFFVREQAAAAVQTERDADLCADCKNSFKVELASIAFCP